MKLNENLKLHLVHAFTQLRRLFKLKLFHKHTQLQHENCNHLCILLPPEKKGKKISMIRYKLQNYHTHLLLENNSPKIDMKHNWQTHTQHESVLIKCNTIETYYLWLSRKTKTSSSKQLFDLLGWCWISIILLIIERNNGLAIIALSTVSFIHLVCFMRAFR